jgi:hypothetical protein
MTANSTLTYFKINGFIYRWILCGGADGCEPFDEASLGTDLPPPMPPQPKPLPVPKKSAAKQDRVDKTLDDLLCFAEAVSRYRTWLSTPEPPKPGKPLKIEPRKREVIPTFDIQEIPRTMRKLHMPMGAALMERWFAGDLNYSPDDQSEVAELNQDGAPYPPSMIDKTDVKMKWVLGFSRAKEQRDNLIENVIRSPSGVGALRKILLRYVNNGSVNASEMCGNDLALIHKHFQFEYVPVEGTFMQKAMQALNRAIQDRGVPDDLTAALGSFNIYAAVESAYIDRNRVATVKAISIYIKDPYTFTTDRGEVSQYLGHWSSKGVIVVPITEIATLGNQWWANFPVKIGDAHRKGNVYYPVRNSDFRNWQMKHRRGGDFVIYSDREVLSLLTRPIVIQL